MKNILKKVAGIAMVVTLAFGIFSCNNSSKDEHIDDFNMDSWEYDEFYHWHEPLSVCAYGHVKNKAGHSFTWVEVKPATHESEGMEERKCNVCGYVDSHQEIPKLLDHIFSETLTYDETYHWYAATCEHEDEVKDKVEHDFSNWVSNDDATKNEDGTKWRHCYECFYKETVIDVGSKLPKYDLGDFVLKDGTVLDRKSTPESGTVAAVIIRATENGKPALGVGIVHEVGLSWCERSASGYDTKIITLLEDGTKSFMDGSNSWNLLVEACEDLKNATTETFETVAQNYPAFNYCRKYGTKNGLEGELAEGWYLPTVAELYTINQNKRTIDESLSKAGGNQFGNKFYRSCCQFRIRGNTMASEMDFNLGREDGSAKDNGYGIYVCSVRAFN